MKRILVKIMILGMISFFHSQNDYVFSNKSLVLNAGIGFGNYYGIGWFAQGYSQLPYLNASLDYSIYKIDDRLDISAGGYFGYTSWSYSSNTTYYTKSGQYKSGLIKQRWSLIHIGARGGIHYSVKDIPLELYGCLILGYGISSYSVNDPDFYYRGVSYSRLYPGLIGGARYYFNTKFGAYGELGYGISLLNLGISLKLK